MASLRDHATRTSPRQFADTVRRHQRLWLVLALDDVPLAIAALAPEAEVIGVSDPAEFRRQLASLQPSIAVCTEPPADPAVVEAVARDRRSRPAMRMVHRSQPDAVARRLEALSAGFDDALATTVPVAELVGRLRLLEDRVVAPPKRRAILPVTHDLVLDLEAHALWRNGTQVHLRPKEFELLAVLAANAGRAMRRQDLLARVWGPERSAESRTVDVHVRWLRAKIEPDPDRAAVLVTVRGVGYRLDLPR